MTTLEQVQQTVTDAAVAVTNAVGNAANQASEALGKHMVPPTVPYIAVSAPESYETPRASPVSQIRQEEAIRKLSYIGREIINRRCLGASWPREQTCQSLPQEGPSEPDC